MRSPRELAFRLRHEAANLWLFVTQPAPELRADSPLKGLSDPPCAAGIERLADDVLRHHFPILGITIDTGPEIRWRHDYLNRRDSSLNYFRFVPYLDFARVGDHKVIWELNRHQHLVLLAQAYRLTGREEFFAEITTQLESWLADNPYYRGINWTSALEVAFRALSWIWIWHLTGSRMAPDFRRRFLIGLYRHACYLEHNLSVYFSPNTHLLGEAVALHALGTLFPEFPGAKRWVEAGGRITHEQMKIQVRDDGSHFEQSTYYQVYALDMFLFHAMIAETPPEYREKLSNMADYLDAVLGPARSLPFLGDDDGGRFFHPYGPRDQFGNATLAACSQFPGWSNAQPRASRLFRDSGLVVMTAGDAHILIDVGPFGSPGAGHSHSDTLSLVARRDGEELLIDPGTYTYISDPEWRNRFRGSAAHNTVRIDGRDQGTRAGPFRWTTTPEVRVTHWHTTPERDELTAECRYAGLTHRRHFVFQKPDVLTMRDEIEGTDEHLVEQFWHPGEAVIEISPNVFQIGLQARLILSGLGKSVLSEGGDYGWRSRALGEKSPAPVIWHSVKAKLPVRLETVLDFSALRRVDNRGSSL